MRTPAIAVLRGRDVEALFSWLRERLHAYGVPALRGLTGDPVSDCVQIVVTLG
ncbi:hypothetical protein [Kribbella rubisoli]|uniref:hypothetical protein n=1 Tax=Kribbella rubisoli TaxID=3075929 RepID=UPI001300A46E|nr:hypothetical protein [Kribbella rubisoli]